MKILSSSLLLLPFLSFATAQGATTAYTEYSFSSPTTNQDGTNKSENKGNYFGFNFSFAADTKSDSNLALPPTFTLDSMSFLVRPDSHTSTHKDGFKVALCSYTTDGTLGGLLSLSSNALTSLNDGSELTFLFGSGITLDTTTQKYQFFFVKEATTADSWSKDSILAAPIGLSLLQSNQTIVGGGYINTSRDNLQSAQGNNFMPNFTIKGHVGEAVPEPSTATLGLLALAGLLLNRRRF